MATAYTTWTTPRTWADNETPGGSIFNTHVRDDLNALRNPPRLRAYKDSNTSLTNGTWTSIAFNQERYKTLAGLHSTVTNSSRLIAALAGTYLGIGYISFAANATGTRALRWLLNGTNTIAETQVPNNGAGPTELFLPFEWDFALNDYV